jgi:O-Antigen ligase
VTSTLRPVTGTRPGGTGVAVAGRAGVGVPPGGAQPGDAGARRRGGLLARHPAWPVTALIVGYPLWWALGIGDFMWIAFAIPMATRMLAWHVHGSRRLRLPPGFGLWLLFLAWSVAGGVMLGLTAPGTVASPVLHRALSYADRNLSYVGVTVLLLYVGNLTERELPRRRLAWMLGLLAVAATVLGIAAMAKPHLQLHSPFLSLLPAGVQDNGFIQASMHPGLAQVQNVFGSGGRGRPKAPFDYTNIWAECLSITMPWLLVACQGARRRRRVLCWSVAVLALVPLIYSLNRGVWLGVGLAAVYIAVRLAARGKVALLGGVCAGLALVAVLVAVSPLQDVISQRLQHGDSNTIRTNLSTLAVKDALASPVLGYGDTRQEMGSPTSIAVGPTAKCPTCGQDEVGSTGQLWLVLECNGLAGAVLYVGFFGYGAWRFRRDRTPYGMVAVLVVGLSLVYMFFYDAVPAPLGLTMLAFAMAWRNESQLRLQEPSLCRGSSPG